MRFKPRTKRGVKIGRTCRGCHRDSWTKNEQGYYVCLPCKRDKANMRRRGKPRDWRSEMLYSARERAKDRGLDFSITLDDIVIPERCPVLGMLLRHGLKDGRNNSPSLDRLDPKKGYTRSNVRVISYRANTIKTNASLDELERVAAWLRRETVCNA